jgi:beta-mannosidase
VSHYFGVGGYLRSLEDAQINEPLFASECLAFSNVPENRGLAASRPEHAALPTDPRYKAGVPRDVGTGWDFADVTDHYIERIFNVDTRKLRLAGILRMSPTIILSAFLMSIRANCAMKTRSGISVWRG